MKTFKWLLTAILIGTTINVNAQDGEQLFKAKCSTCHNLEQNSTGPMLQGVRQKWEDAGELEYLYEWVQNSTELINSGKSAMATSVKDFSPTAMSPQQVSPVEVDAILGYVDGWVKPEEAVSPESPAGKEIIYKPNYASNLNLFYALVTLTIFLLIAIVIMSGTVIRFVKSDYFKKKIKDHNNTANIVILLILFTGVTATNSFALQFNGPGEAAEGAPWLLIGKIDLYALLTVDLILVGVLFYIRRMFKTFLALTQPKKVQAEVEEGVVLKKVNQILTDVVPIEEEESILMHHEYDGIRELDNNLPPWWVWMFYGTIAFAIIYMLNYHVFKTGDLQIQEYKKEVARGDAEVEAYLKSKAMNVDENNVTLLEDDAALNAGQSLFKVNCVLCHSENGEGITGSGPNLTDKNWIYGYDIKDVFYTVKNGRPGGMPEHNSKMNPVQMQQVASYVLSLPEKDGVEAKGDIIEE